MGRSIESLGDGWRWREGGRERRGEGKKGGVGIRGGGRGKKDAGMLENKNRDKGEGNV